jgi:hydrogenase expression/formation protein HypE
MELSCPMPVMDTEVITLGHGSGGILTHRLLDSGVFALLGNPMLDEKHDGAVFREEGTLAFCADSFVVSPLFFPGGNIGDLAVNGTLNDLAMCGARPKYMSLSFIIEEGLQMEIFRKVLDSIGQAARAAGVWIVTGDTKVVEKGKGDGIFINTNGIGVVHPSASLSIRNIRPGDRIIISGQMAAHGVAIMSVRQGLAFESDILSDTANISRPVLDLIEAYGDRIRFLRDPTRGGVATVLNEIVRDTAIGIDIMQSHMPVDEAVGSACEILGLDPLYVASEGIFLAVVDPSIEEDLLQKLKADPLCANAATLGTVTEEHPGLVLLKSAIGGSRVVSMLPGEQLPRIC